MGTTKVLINRALDPRQLDSSEIEVDSVDLLCTTYILCMYYIYILCMRCAKDRLEMWNERWRYIKYIRYPDFAGTLAIQG